MEDGEQLFTNVASLDFLKFAFPANKPYEKELRAQAAKTGKLASVNCMIRKLPYTEQEVMWMEHDWNFFSGTLGCAEGEKIVRGFKLAEERRLPVIIKCRSGGARMQEGTLALQQMAKISSAVHSFKNTELPYITILADPCFGGVSASYAMQSDVRIAEKRARVGFSGPLVIRNTQFNHDQAKYDRGCPKEFQSAEFAFQNGQVDMIVDKASSDYEAARIIRVLMQKREYLWEIPPFVKNETPKEKHFENARKLTRFDSEDIIRECFTEYVELGGDGKIGVDAALRGGIALFKGSPVVLVKCKKGHTNAERHNNGDSMPTPHGYRTALRLFDFAERFNLPIISLVDVVGALPSFEAEILGQSEALATNLLKIAGLEVPIISLLVSEGGSGGALAVGFADRVGMMENAYYAVISPEGAASILGRYDSEAHRKVQFPADLRTIANMQGIYSDQLLDLGAIDEIVYEYEDAGTDFPQTAAEISKFFARALHDLWLDDKLVENRGKRSAKFGHWQELTDEERLELTEGHHGDASGAPRPSLQRTEKKISPPMPLYIKYLVETTVNGEHSYYRGKSPLHEADKGHPSIQHVPRTNFSKNAKSILDSEGPKAMAKWVREQNRVLLTDTTMRDAHQSLLATRVRTIDLVNSAETASALLHDCFSLECWGGATFDVAYNFNREDPWERLRLLREKIPNICLQMLLRGSSTVGYNSFPDSVVRDFVHLAAKNGLDVFRIFDCFNDLEQMRVAIDAVVEVNKVAEVAICFTGDFLNPKEKIYTLEYFADLARKIGQTQAHMVAIKDMAGLLKPGHCQPLVQVLRAALGPAMPLHFHTHNTSSTQLATLIAMSDAGVDVVDACMASMADTTSQPSMNGFLAAMENRPRDPCISWKELEILDLYWMRLRAVYAIFETDMHSGTASVYTHQIPGGQYSNLLMQCKSMGIMERWPEVLETYHQVNLWMGDVIKVTPSSKVVGDVALMLVGMHRTVDELNHSPELVTAWPKSAIDMARGTLGRPHHGFPDAMVKAILGDIPPLVGRPGALLESVDLEAVRVAQGLETLEEACSSILYPKEFKVYQERMSEHGPVWQLPTSHFLYGFFGIGDTFSVDGHEVKLDRIQALDFANKRKAKVLVDGFPSEVTSLEAMSKTKHKLASGAPQEIGSPIQGVLSKIECQEGARYKKGDALFVVCAMKMEVTISAPDDCTISKIHLKESDALVENSLVATVAL
eukprot:GEMP01003879.1.p1 GENE.GEMP01003879.1~~GEMP01003879.1.p1  ORF type:complete len:1220 (+),score=277.91 GEMP01003879.1:44-3703(+)